MANDKAIMIGLKYLIALREHIQQEKLSFGYGMSMKELNEVIEILYLLDEDLRFSRTCIQ